MHRYITFDVPGEPMGKGRPKFSTIGGHARAHTPKKTVEYENLVKMAYREACGSGEVLEGMLSADISAYFTQPKAGSKKLHAEMSFGTVRPTKKPDCDNIAKIILDALNGIAYKDDSQIVDCRVRKYYTDETCPAHVEVFISEYRGNE